MTRILPSNLVKESYMDNESNSSTHSKSVQHKSSSNIFVWMILILVVGAGSFYSGVTYEKSHHTTTASNVTGSSNYRRGFGARDRVFGQVTAISSSSITVQNSRTGTNTTLAITSSTQITDNGQTATASSIQTGEEVFITENSSDTSQAARVMVNPSFGGGPMEQSEGSSTSATTD